MPTSVPPPLVVALGGNAITPADIADTIERQFAHTAATMEALATLATRGQPLVVTHGNGPQIGGALRRVELARDEVYPLPIDVCVADLQGGMGYMISQSLANALVARGVTRPVTTIVTTVEVSDDDPAFGRPTKPIGPYYSGERAETLIASGWHMIEVAGHGFRRVVASPRPRAIVEIDVLRDLVARGWTIVAAGGGGVPVARADDGTHAGREAVIDKDHASALLAAELGAETLVIVTSVDRVALDFETPAERRVDRLTADDARRHLDDGQFPAGSMGPKIEAAIDFLARAGAGARVIITDVAGLPAALAGTAGTTITTR